MITGIYILTVCEAALCQLSVVKSALEIKSNQMELD